MLFDLISNIKKTVFFALFSKSRLNDVKSKCERVNEKQSEKEGEKKWEKEQQINGDIEKRTQEVFNGIRAIE